MSQLRVVPIVEGHGEVESIRILLTRVWIELLAGSFIDVLKPIRISRSKIVNKRPELERAVELASTKLRNSTTPHVSGMVLVLIDADDDLPCILGPRLLEEGQAAAGGCDLACVVANLEYETWFVAAAESLRQYLRILPDDEIPHDPESARKRKGWIESRFLGSRYSETVDQPAMTARMDLTVCRARSPSFDKLCRELEQRRHRVIAAP